MIAVADHQAPPSLIPLISQLAELGIQPEAYDPKLDVDFKGTLFRAFGDRSGLLRALYEARLEPITEAVEAGPPLLGPGTPPQERAPALLDAVLCFKLDNRRLALALEEIGSSSPYQAEHYERWHCLLQAVLEQIPGLTDSDFTAHALLAATRADLVEHLAGQERVSRARMRAWTSRPSSQVRSPAGLVTERMPNWRTSESDQTHQMIRMRL
ncbi:TetR/AcrR family transcriptional regulator [Streptomyces sioyaensis]|uniref:TetR/AcrR family transcriptional regulator n=1 Tax=Streptomyces sioyaensis TaxID=67364 RepID=UPI0037CEBCAA